jgi:hypothetical protein
MDAVLDWFLSLPDRPALRTVGLHPIWRNNPETVTKLLIAVEHSFESFLISSVIADGMFVILLSLHANIGSDWPIDLRRNTSLCSLQIEVGSNDDDTGLVTQVLSQLEEVRLEISVGNDDELGQMRWNEVDAFLLLGLKTVTVRAVQWPYIFESNAVSWIEDRMPYAMHVAFSIFGR